MSPALRHGEQIVVSMTDDQRRAARERAHRFALRRVASADLLAEAHERRNDLARYRANLEAGDFTDGDAGQLRGGVAFETRHLSAIADELDRRQRAERFGYQDTARPSPDLAERFSRAKAIDCANVMHALTGETSIRAGERTRFACPFHDDDDPSLICYPAGRGWWCPVCGIGGDGVRLASELRGISAVEALDLIEALGLDAA